MSNSLNSETFYLYKKDKERFINYRENSPTHHRISDLSGILCRVWAVEIALKYHKQNQYCLKFPRRNKFTFNIDST